MRATSILLLTAAGIIAVCISAFSQLPPQPYTVKADRLGETPTEWKANNPRFEKCDNGALEELSDSPVDRQLVYCLTRRWEQGQDFTYATTPLLTETAWFYKDSLYKVEMTLLSDVGLSNLVAGLKRKFGKPAGRETSQTRNGFGARSDHKRLTWTNRVSSLELTYSNSPNDHPQVTFTLNAPSKELADRANRNEQVRARLDM